MSSKPRLRIRHSLALRLTLWYAGMFLVSAGVAFAFFYFFITAAIRDRTDQDLLSEVRTFANAMGLQGVDAVMRRAAIDAQAAGEKKIFIRLLTPDGRIFSSSNMEYWRNIFISGEAIRRMIDESRPVFATMRSPDGIHEVRVVYAQIGPGLVIQLGQAMDDLTRLIDAFRRIFAVSMTALLLSAAVMGWFMARRALAGVTVVTRTARRIADGNLNERVPVKRHGDEVDQLALTFNQMVERIQVLVTGIKEMTDNIAHDLKGPITRIRGQAEVALTAGGSTEDYETLASSAIEDCDRLLEMIDAMLFISRSEAGVTRPDLKEMDLAAVVRSACGLFQALAEEKQIGLTWEAPQSFTIAADIRLIQRMLANLLDNAIKYTPEGGAVSVALRSSDGSSATIEVRDSGAGISPADLPHIFERFYRGDPSRSQPGAGLGLSFARAVAHAHGGDIKAASAASPGSVFTLSLPIQPPAWRPCELPQRGVLSS